MIEIKKYKRYYPKDPKFRHGFKAQVSKINNRLNKIWYFVGGQKFIESIDDFLEKYDVK